VKLKNRDQWLKEAADSWREFQVYKALQSKLNDGHPTCPTDVSRELVDGLVTMEPENILSLQFQLLVKCGSIKPWAKWPQAKNVSLKKKADCVCLEGDVGGYEKLPINSEIGKTKFKQYKAEDSCRVGQYFVICHLHNGVPTQALGCPKECLSWK